MFDIAFSFSAASLAASSCLQNLCDLLIIRGALKLSLKASQISSYYEIWLSSEILFLGVVAKAFDAGIGIV